MGKEILFFGDIDIEQEQNVYHHKSPIFFKYVDIEKILVTNKISLVKKTINNLLVTCIMITKLCHYI